MKWKDLIDQLTWPLHTNMERRPPFMLSTELHRRTSLTLYGRPEKGGAIPGYQFWQLQILTWSNLIVAMLKQPLIVGFTWECCIPDQINTWLANNRDTSQQRLPSTEGLARAGKSPIEYGLDDVKSYERLDDHDYAQGFAEIEKGVWYFEIGKTTGITTGVCHGVEADVGGNTVKLPAISHWERLIPRRIPG